MIAYLWVIACLQVCLAGRLQILLPAGHVINKESMVFNSDSLLKFNKETLGMETDNVGNGKNLFEKPKALVVISIRGLDDFTYDGHLFNFTDDTFHSHQMRENLLNHFGDEMIHVDVNSTGIYGSPMFKRNVEAKGGDSEHQDIQNMFDLANAIKEKDRKSANVVDYYRIHLDVSNARTEMEKKQLEKDLKAGVDELNRALQGSYDGKVLAEIFTHEEVSEKANHERLMNIRKHYQITRPNHQDYPAMFGIALLIVFALFFGTIAAIFMMFDDGDMGKNSIVYRLSTGRQKKE